MLRDILKDSIDLARKPISDRQFMTDFNRAAHDMAMMYDTAKLRNTKVIACDNPMTEYALTDGCLKIERILTTGGNYFSSYEVRGNAKILFAVRDTYTVYELFDQPAITAMSDVVTINTAYLKAIAEFIAAKATVKSDPELSRSLMANSATDADLANRNIRRANNPNRRVYAPRFR